MSLFNFGFAKKGVTTQRRDEILVSLENASTEAEVENIIKALSPDELKSVGDLVAAGEKPGPNAAHSGAAHPDAAGLAPSSEGDKDEQEPHDFDSFGDFGHDEDDDEDEADADAFADGASGAPKGSSPKSPLTKGNFAKSGHVDATEFLAQLGEVVAQSANDARTVVQGNAELAQGLHIAIDLVKSLAGEVGDVRAALRDESAARAALEAKLDAQSQATEQIVKALPDFEENAHFIKSLRQSPIGHPMRGAGGANASAGTFAKAANAGSAEVPQGGVSGLPVGGVAQRPLMGADSLSGAFSGADEGAGFSETEATRFGLSQRNFMKGVRSLNQNELQDAGLSVDQYFSIQSGTTPFGAVPKSVLQKAAAKIGLVLSDAE